MVTSLHLSSQTSSLPQVPAPHLCPPAWSARITLCPRENRNLWNRTMWPPNTHLGSQAHLHTPSSPPLHLHFPGPGASFLNPGAPPCLVPLPLLQHPFFPSIISPSFPKAFSHQSRNICKFAPLKRRRARDGGKELKRRRRRQKEDAGERGEDRKRRNNKHWAESYIPACEGGIVNIFTARKLSSRALSNVTR